MPEGRHDSFDGGDVTDITHRLPYPVMLSSRLPFLSFPFLLHTLYSRE
jgi:hypothetical protein